MPVINHQKRTLPETGIGQDTRAAFACAARDVPSGTSWAFHHHRTMKDVFADERLTRRPRATAPKPGAFGGTSGAGSRNRHGPVPPTARE